MKGMLNFLERAGLVKRDEPVELRVDAAEKPTQGLPASDLAGVSAEAGTLGLDEIYAAAGITAAAYPAERLLRLIDGLSAMDSATRLLAIKAMDSADESWSIDDPVADAAAKTQALARHGQALQQNLRALEQDTATRLGQLAAHQEQSVGEIRKQIAELEALAAREVARSAQQMAAHEAELQAARQHTALQLEALASTSQRLQSLTQQFGVTVASRKD